MFRIRRIHDQLDADARATIAQVQDILRAQFTALRPEEIDALPTKLEGPKQGFHTILFVAERTTAKAVAFAILLHDPELHFCYLDFISAAPGRTAGGVGGAVYRAVRDSAKELGAHGIYMECLPDDPTLCRDRSILPQNRARLRFYERFGARPIVGTRYEEPAQEGDDAPPYLVFDPLDTNRGPSRKQARAVVRAILERKCAWLCTPEYNERVIASFRADPLELRPERYTKNSKDAAASRAPRVVMVANDRHDIHHVRERGYVEAPARLASILEASRRSGLFEERSPKHFNDRHLLAVHDDAYVSYFRRACDKLQPDRAIYPYVFPVRNVARPPKEMSVRAGYYCIDTFTPLTHNAYLAARRAVDCTLTGALAVLNGRPVAYALVRPPGHHAERGYFGGFCYFNNSAIAAHWLVPHGHVALLDLDYHHGNGQQQIFYQRSDVLTVSIHGHPSFAYPYFSGFADERGEGEGEGFNVNLPLPEAVDGPRYREVLGKALRRVHRYRPAFLVVSLGLDTARADPTGTWSLATDDFEQNGRMVGALGLPTLVVQEGGYRVRALGRNAVAFFRGLLAGHQTGIADPQKRRSMGGAASTKKA